MAYMHDPPRETHTYRDLDPDPRTGGPANLPSRALIPIQMNEFAILRVSSAPKYAGMLRYLGLALCVAF